LRTTMSPAFRYALMQLCGGITGLTVSCLFVKQRRLYGQTKRARQASTACKG